MVLPPAGAQLPATNAARRAPRRQPAPEPGASVRPAVHGAHGTCLVERRLLHDAEELVLVDLAVAWWE
eukprot:scaffold16974_cov55-Phaeocystis_antarctica.AAC.3